MTTRKFTRAEVAARPRDSPAVIIDNFVYDVSEFHMDHPGGPEVLLDNAGKDVSKCFLDVGHSDIAINWRKEFMLGEIVESEHWEVKTESEGSGYTKIVVLEHKPRTLAGMLGEFLWAFIVVFGTYYLYDYFFS